MNIIILNNSVNTGKTTLSKHLFVPQMGPNVTSMSIGSRNLGHGETVHEINSNEFKSLAILLSTADEDQNFVVDCGVINIEMLLQNMLSVDATHSAVDYWVIPTVPQKLVIIDSALTVRSLLDMGISPNKIVIVLNNISDWDDIPEDFKLLFEFEKLGVHLTHQGVLANEVFDEIIDLNKTVFDIASKPIDFKAMRKEALASNDPNESLKRLAESLVISDMSTSAKMNLISVFQSTPIYKDLQAKK